MEKNVTVKNILYVGGCRWGKGTNKTKPYHLKIKWNCYNKLFCKYAGPWGIIAKLLTKKHVSWSMRCAKSTKQHFDKKSRYRYQKSRVADPVPFWHNPDPANQNFLNRIRIQLALTKWQFEHLNFSTSIRYLLIFE